MIDPPKSHRPDGQLQKPAILVVEDEVLVRLMLGDSLREQGYAVIEAANADEALTVLRSATHVGLVLTDIRMPGATDGLGLARFVRAQHPAMKIIVVSAFSPALGANDVDAFIRKPYNLIELTQRIRELIGE